MPHKQTLLFKKRLFVRNSSSKKIRVNVCSNLYFVKSHLEQVDCRVTVRISL